MAVDEAPLLGAPKRSYVINGIAFAGSFVLLMLAGTFYAFAIWLPDMKLLLGLSQTEMNWCGTAVYIPMSIIAMPLYTALSNLSCCSNSAWKYAMSLFVAISLFASGFWLVYLSSWQQHDRALTVLAVGCVSLSCAIGVFYPSVYNATFAFLPSHMHPFANGLLSLSFALGGSASMLWYRYFSHSDTLTPRRYAFAQAALVTSCLVLCVPIQLLSTRSQTNLERGEAENKDEHQSINEPAQNAADPPSFASSLLKGNLLRPFALVCLISFLKVGIGATFTTNLADLALSLGERQDLLPRRVLGFQLSQTIGRVVAAVALNPALFPNTNNTLFILLSVSLLYLGVLSATWIVWLTGNELTVELLTILTWVIGPGYGAMWTLNALMPALVTQRIDLWAPLASCAAFSGCLATGTLNLIVGWLYDREAERQQSSTHECIGTVCYATAFGMLAMLALLLLCVVCGTMMLHRTRTGSLFKMPA